MSRVRVLGMTTAVVLVVATVGMAGAAKLDNGNFEAGNFSHWKKETDGHAKWRIYTNKDRDVGVTPVARGAGSGIRLPKTLGKYSPVIDMNDAGHRVLYRTIKVPDDATKLSLKAYWHNDAGSWVFNGKFKPVEIGNQYFSIDLLRRGANPESTKSADVLANLFAPDASDVPPPPVVRSRYGPAARRGGSGGSTTPYVSDWRKFSADLKPYRGEKVLLRLAETDTQSYNFVGIDNVKIATKKK